MAAPGLTGDPGAWMGEQARGGEQAIAECLLPARPDFFDKPNNATGLPLRLPKAARRPAKPPSPPQKRRRGAALDGLGCPERQKVAGSKAKFD